MPSQDTIYDETLSRISKLWCLGYSRDLESNLWEGRTIFYPYQQDYWADATWEKSDDLNITLVWKKKIEIK